MNELKWDRMGRWFLFSLTAAVILVTTATSILHAENAGDPLPCSDFARATEDNNPKKKPEIGGVVNNIALDLIDTPWQGDSLGDPEITMTWGSLKVLFRKADFPKSPGVYVSTHPNVHCSLAYDESGGNSAYKIENNGYKIHWNASKKLTLFQDPNGVDLLSNVVTGEESEELDDEDFTYDKGARSIEVDNDPSTGRPLTITERLDIEIVKTTYIRDTEEDGTGKVLRKRVTVKTCNSDGSARFLTTIYVYHGATYNYRLKFIVEPEGVNRYLTSNGSTTLAYGIALGAPGGSCGLDVIATVSDAALAEYASVIYHEYDSSGRVTKVQGGSGCCGGGGEDVKYLFWYNDNGNGSHVAGDANSWKEYRRKAVAVVVNTVWSATDDDPRTVEFINEYGGVVYEVKLEVSNNSVVNSWITHYKYETKSFTAATSNTCTSNGHGLYTGQSIRVSTTGTIPAGLVAGTEYWARSIDANTFTLHTSKAGAEGDTGTVDIASEGSGNSLQYNRISEVRSPLACASAEYGTTTSSGWVTAVASTSQDDGTDGLVRVYEYYSAESSNDYETPWEIGCGSGENNVTYTSGTAKYGSFKGQLAYEKVRKGTGGGTTHYLRKYTYIRTDYGDSDIYHPYQETVYPTYETSDQNGVTTTNHYQFFKEDGTSNATHAAEVHRVEYPAVLTANNGSNSATEVWYAYKQDTTNDLYYLKWTKHEDGSLSYTNLNTDGTVEKTIVDVNTATVSDDKPSSWSNSGLHLQTSYTYDSYGRTLTVTDPASGVTKYAYMCQSSTESGKETTTSLVTLVAPFISETNYSYLPVQIAVTDLAGRTIHSAAGTPDDGATDGCLYDDWVKDTKTLTYGFKVNSSAVVTARTDNEYDLNGQLLRMRRYHTMPDDNATDDSGDLGDDYYLTVYQYDDLGRQTHTIQVMSGTDDTGLTGCVEQVTKQVYDGLGRVKEVHRGVSDASHVMKTTVPYDTYPTLYKLSATYYDESTVGSGTSGVGDGRVTSTRGYFDSGANDYVLTEYYYDYRSRLRGTSTGGYNSTTETWVMVGPFVVSDYDNMGRTIASAAYDTEPTWTGASSVVETVDYAAATTSHRVTLSKTHYDQKGQVWKTEDYKVTDGESSNPMATNYWYDAAGRTIKVKDASGMFSKTQYDGAGRAVASFACYDTAETAYGDADDVTGDTVIRVAWTEFEDNRAVGQWAGTKLGDVPTQSNPNAGGGSGNMVRVARTWYDTDYDGDYGENSVEMRPYAVGVSTLKANLTSAPDEDDATTEDHDSFYVKIKYDYDSAGRRYKITLPAASGGGDGNYTTTTFDDFGRSLITQTYKQGPVLLTKAENAYCAAGVESTKIYKVSSGQASDDHIKTTYDYDGFGQLRKTTQPSGAFTKTVYDNYGRVTGSYLCSDGGAGTDDPLTITGDTVVEQSVPSYDDVGRVWLATSYQRNHDGTGTGALDADNARITYAVTWWDNLGRTKWAASYGTNGGTPITGKSYGNFDGSDHDYDDAAMTYGTSDYIVTYFEYDTYGRNHQVTDNAGHKTRTFFDTYGRRTHVVENYTNFDPTDETATAGGTGETPDHSEDRVTKFTYVGVTSLLKEQIAIDPDDADDNQITRYVYAAELTDQTYHPVRDGARLRAVIYPDSNDDEFTGTPESPGSLDTTDPDHVELAYYADGSTYKRKDQRGCEHTYEYDDLGRPTKDLVTALGGADNTVQSISYTYDDLGRREKITSHSDNDPDMTNWTDVANQVEYAYNDMGLPEKEYQEHEGAKDGNTLHVRYNYDDTVVSNVYTKGMRPKSFRYPSYSDNKYTRTTGAVVARLVYSTYGAADSIADRLSRVNAIENDADGNETPDATPLSVYSYNGSGTIVIEDYQQPTVKLDYFGGSSGTYAGFDRFGRVVLLSWLDYTPEPGSELVAHGYTYDAASNRTSRDNGLTTGKDEKYTYDGLDRLTGYDRGTLSGGNITSKVRNEAWTLSQTGNWDAYKINTNPGEDSDYTDATDLDQERSHNDVNEITGITEQSNPQQEQWADPVHDPAGNMTTVPKPTDMTSTFAAAYDAWNRLALVYIDVNTDGDYDDGTDTLIGKYEYDGLNRRIKKHIDTQAPASPNGVDTYRHFYYNAGWQIVETRSTTSGENTEPETLQPEYQYVWSLRYIDAPILRDENDDTNDLCDDERLYYLNDANMNVTCLTDENGDAVERYIYDPYGNVTIMTGGWGARGSSSYDNEILYCGYRHDPETGLYHVRNRYYHPTLGRWVSRDPIEYGINLYEYCISSPAGYVDWSGAKPSRAQLEKWIEYEKKQSLKYHKTATRARRYGCLKTHKHYRKLSLKSLDRRLLYERMMKETGIGGTASLGNGMDYFLPMLESIAPKKKISFLYGQWVLAVWPPGISVELELGIFGDVSLCKTKKNTCGIQLSLGAEARLSGGIGTIIGGRSNTKVAWSQKGKKIIRDNRTNRTPPKKEFSGWRKWKPIREQLLKDTLGIGGGIPDCKQGFELVLSAGVRGMITYGVRSHEIDFKFVKYDFKTPVKWNWKPTYKSKWGPSGVGFRVELYGDAKGKINYAITFDK